MVRLLAGRATVLFVAWWLMAGLTRDPLLLAVTAGVSLTYAGLSVLQDRIVERKS